MVDRLKEMILYRNNCNRLSSYSTANQNTLILTDSPRLSLISNLHIFFTTFYPSKSRLLVPNSLLHGLSSRLHGLSSRLHGLNSRLHGLSSRLHRLNSRLHGLSSRLHGLSSRLHGPSSRLHGLSSRLHGGGKMSNENANMLIRLENSLQNLLINNIFKFIKQINQI